MTDTAEVTSGGTAVSDAGSQVPQQNADASQGVEGASTAQEPTVDIDGKQVPLSEAKLALKNNERFTQESQRLAEERKALEAREREIQDAQLKQRGLDSVAQALQNPETRQKLAEVVPDLELPDPNQGVNQTLLADNLRLKFELFTSQHPEFSDDQLAGIRAEVYSLATQGRVDAALDFDAIGFRLYKDAIIEHETQKRLDAQKKDQQARDRQARQAGTVPAGMPHIPAGVDASKLSGGALISLGHAQKTSKPR